MAAHGLNLSDLCVYCGLGLICRVRRLSLAGILAEAEVAAKSIYGHGGNLDGGDFARG